MKLPIFEKIFFIGNNETECQVSEPAINRNSISEENYFNDNVQVGSEDDC